MFSEDMYIGKTLEESMGIFENTIYLCNSFMEKSLNEFFINMKEAELKVIVENGNYGDIIYLEKEAKDSAFEKFKKGLKKFFQSIIDWIKKVKDSILGNNVERDLKSIQKNEEAKKTKIELEDVEYYIKKSENYVDFIQREASKHKAQVEINKLEIEKRKKEIKEAKKRKKIFTVAAAAGIALGLVAALTKESDKVKKCAEKLDEKLEFDNDAYILQRAAEAAQEVSKDMTSFISKVHKKGKGILDKVEEKVVPSVKHDKKKFINPTPKMDELEKPENYEGNDGPVGKSKTKFMYPHDKKGRKIEESADIGAMLIDLIDYIPFQEKEEDLDMKNFEKELNAKAENNTEASGDLPEEEMEESNTPISLEAIETEIQEAEALSILNDIEQEILESQASEKLEEIENEIMKESCISTFDFTIDEYFEKMEHDIF